MLIWSRKRDTLRGAALMERLKRQHRCALAVHRLAYRCLYTDSPHFLEFLTGTSMIAVRGYPRRQGQFPTDMPRKGTLFNPLNRHV